MTDNDLIDFGIWREMDEEITGESAKQAALEASQGAIAELEEESDVQIEWVRTDVLAAEDAETDYAYCHYRAPSEAAIEEHSERAGLPVSRMTRIDEQFDRDDLEGGDQ